MFFFSSRRRHTRSKRDWSSDVCSSDLIKLILRALEAPLRTIVSNAGEEASVIVNQVAEKEGNYGYNASTGEFGDLEIGRASCRERGESAVVAVSGKKERRSDGQMEPGE